MSFAKKSYDMLNKFNELFPLTKVQTMTLDEYTNLDKTSFCYWIENELNDWGNIHGATSYKFGIYRWNKRPDGGKPGVLADEEYAWQDRFGNTPQEAFKNIRDKIVQIILSIQKNEFEKIDTIDISEMFKWKIAFLYSDGKLIDWFSRDALFCFTEKFGRKFDKKTPTSVLQKFLIEKKGNKSFDEFDEELIPIWKEYQEQNNSNSWIPEDYTPNISTEQWKELVINPDIFTQDSLITFACIQKARIATCSDIATEFGRTKNFYNNGNWRAGERVHKVTQCPLSEREVEGVRFWSVCCLGRQLKNKLWEYKIRPELEEAFEETGVLKNIKLYENEKGATKMSKAEEFANLLLNTHNLILHGAPGTGKTHLARDIAKAMGCTDNEIGFVQFHPSYDYTDFVEGLRPVNDGTSGQIAFERKDGVFKKFCERALKNLIDSKKSAEEIEREKSVDEKIDSFLNAAIDDEKEFQTVTGNRFCVTDFNEKNIYISIPENEKVKELVLQRVELSSLLNAEDKIDNGTAVKDFFKRKWRTQQDSYVFVLYKEIFNRKNASSSAKTLERVELKRFVFIIDEINRGEMSKIFGELFFSIDSGYRGEDGLIQTQYQNLISDGDAFADGFYVPENVYIIGTMNDIDRNVESMDFAFRRRFTFKEIKATDTQQDILAGLDDSIREDAIRRMNSLNDAISNIEGLSSAYHIGGAYFLKLKDLDNDFEKLWEYHLEGLLREYLRGMEDAEIELKKLKEAYENPSDNLGEQD